RASATAAEVKTQLRVDMLSACGDRARPHHGRHGETVTLITRGVDALDAYITGYLPQLCLAAAVPVAVLATLVFGDWPSTVIIAITLPLIPIFGALIGWHTEAKTKRQWRTLARLGGHFLDAVAGLSTLRIFGRVAAHAAAVRDSAERYRRTTMETLRVAFLSALVLELVATVSVALVAVPIGLRLVDGTMSLRIAFLVLLLAPEVYLPLRSVGTQFHAAQEGLAAMNDAFAVMDARPTSPTPTAETMEPPNPGPQTYPQAKRCPQDGEEGVDSAGVGRVTLKIGEEVGGPRPIRIADVVVRYPDRDNPALNGVSLTVEAGQTIALIGPSGAGKSTLLNVLLGCAPVAEGRVTYGDIDLADVDSEGWLRNIAWVPQRPHLFAMSVADNIRLGQPDATPAQVRHAADAAHATEFISTLPRDFDTELGDAGFGLSTGQRRRVALARAFLRIDMLDCPLVLLDEPTASMDIHSEHAVTRATRDLLRGRAAVVVAHRSALVDLADAVVSVAHGRVAAQRREVASRA
ncbi:MAG TPA: thiol reductant ABC exporter subunit CydD, partial [Stackebrandtia sp.]|uniref:thiol reductant ABC exporter subunit CydD n=1 Tax=Stackebrandtia sp. TaxID=2023065 RepID=UPI002D244234